MAYIIGLTFYTAIIIFPHIDKGFGKHIGKQNLGLCSMNKVWLTTCTLLLQLTKSIYQELNIFQSKLFCFHVTAQMHQVKIWDVRNDEWL